MSFSRIILLSIIFLVSAVPSFGAEPPICLSANDMSISSGKSSLVTMSNGSARIPVRSLSGGSVGQSVAGLVKLPASCEAVKVEIVVTTPVSFLIRRLVMMAVVPAPTAGE